MNAPILRIIACVTVLTLTNCASLTPTQQNAQKTLNSEYGITDFYDANAIDKAIYEKDSDKVRLLLEAADERVLQDWGRYTSEWMRKTSENGDFDSYKIIISNFQPEQVEQGLFTAFPKRKGLAYVCNDEGAKLLVDRGIRLTPEKSYHLEISAKSLCEDTVREVLSKQPELIVAAAKGFSERITDEVGKAENTDKPFFWIAETQGRVDSFGKYLVSFATTRCESTKTSCSSAKKAAESLKAYQDRAAKLDSFLRQEETDQAARAEKSRLESEFADSEEGRLQKICQIIRIRKGAEERIAHQKKIGKKSGVINQKILHDAGNQAVAAEEWLEL